MKIGKFNFSTAASVLLIALGVAGLAIGQGMHHRGGMGPDFGFGFGGHMMGYLTDVLDLTQAQQDQIKTILDKEKTNVQPLMKQLMQAHQDLRKLDESGTFDEAKVRAIAAQNTPALTELLVQKARIHSEVMQVLTPEQKTKLQQLHAKHAARFKKHMAPDAPEE